MAFATRYFARWSNSDSLKYRCDIQQDNYEGTSEELQASDNPFSYAYDGDGRDKTWQLWPMNCELILTLSTYHQLESLLYATDREFKLIVYRNEILDNQEFDSDTDWVDDGTDWTISSGSASVVAITAGTDTSRLYQTVSLKQGVYEFEVSYGADNPNAAEAVNFEILGYDGSWDVLKSETELTDTGTIEETFRIVINKDYTRIGFRFTDQNTTADYNADVHYFRIKRHIFKGYVISDLTNEDYTAQPYRITIKGTDGLGDLVSFPYWNDGALYGAFQTQMTVVTNIFDKIGLGLNINENVDVFGQGFTISSNVGNLTQDFIYSKTYEDPETGDAEDCETVLKEILRGFSVRIFQAFGEWWIIRPKLQKEAFDIRTYNSSGSVLGSTAGFDPVLILDANSAASKDFQNVTSGIGKKESVQGKGEAKVTTDRGGDFSVLKGINFADDDFPTDTTLTNWATTSFGESDPLNIFSSATIAKSTIYGQTHCRVNGWTPDHFGTTTGDPITDNTGKVRITKTSHGVQTSDWVVIDTNKYGKGIYQPTATATNTFDLDIDYTEDDTAFWLTAGNAAGIEIEDPMPFGENITLEDITDASQKIKVEADYHISTAVDGFGVFFFIILIAKISNTDYKVLGNDGLWHDHDTDEFRPIVVRETNSGAGSISVEGNLVSLYGTLTHDMYLGITGGAERTSLERIHYNRVKVSVIGGDDETITETISTNNKINIAKTLRHPDAPQDVNDEYLYLNPYRKLSGGDHLMTDKHIEAPFHDIVADYKLDETTGTTATDHVSGHDGTISGTVTVGVAGKIGTAYQFATDGLINIDDLLTNELASTTTGAWEAWIKPDDATPAALETIISFGDTNANEYIRIGIQTGGELRIACVLGGVTQYILETDNPVFSDGVYTHIMVVHNGTEAKLYIDEEFVAQSFSGTPPDKTIWFNDLTGLDNGRIACRNANSAGNTQFFNGDIDSVRFYTANKTEVSELYNFNKGLEGFYTIEEIYANNLKKIYEKNSTYFERGLRIVTDVEPSPLYAVQDNQNFGRVFMFGRSRINLKDPNHGYKLFDGELVEITPAGPIGPEDPFFNDPSKWNDIGYYWPTSGGARARGNFWTISGSSASVDGTLGTSSTSNVLEWIRNLSINRDITVKLTANVTSRSEDVSAKNELDLVMWDEFDGSYDKAGGNIELSGVNGSAATDTYSVNASVNVSATEGPFTRIGVTATIRSSVGTKGNVTINWLMLEFVSYD